MDTPDDIVFLAGVAAHRVTGERDPRMVSDAGKDLDWVGLAGERSHL